MAIKIRQACLWVHRYSGLVMAAFLFMAGITGALLAFHQELDDVFNHKLAYVDVEPRPQLPIATLHDKVIEAYPEYKFSSMPVMLEPNKSAVFVVDRARGKRQKNKNTAPFQEVYVNPYTAEIIGSRDKEAWAFNNTMWKVFWLHRELLMGKVGNLILGIVALLWTINCFIGIYLTLPRATQSKAKAKANLSKSAVRSHNRASWFKRWLPAWKIRRKSNFFKFNYDVHQAFGLWLWVMLFVIAWSSVGFNLRSVYQPVMQAVVGLQPFEKGGRHKPDTKSDTESDNQAVAKAHDVTLKITKAQSIEYLSAQAQKVSLEHGLKVEKILGLRWVDEDKQWQMRFKTNKDIGNKGGVSSLNIDAVTGQVVKINLGHQSPTGNKINEWLNSLHMGHIGGDVVHRIYQVFLALIGIAVSALSFTGVYLWWRGNRARKTKAMRGM